jgi:hypothetical protein
VKQLALLLKEVTELEAKRAFLKAILEDRLILMRKTDEEIVAGLKTVGIPPLSDAAAPDTVQAYEYVLRLRIDRVKASAVLELEREVAEKNEQKAILEGLAPASMWLKDLGEFKEAWSTYKDVRTGEMSVSAEKVGAGGKKKRVVIKRK